MLPRSPHRTVSFALEPSNIGVDVDPSWSAATFSLEPGNHRIVIKHLQIGPTSDEIGLVGPVLPLV